MSDQTASQNLAGVDWAHSRITAGHGIYVDAANTNLAVTSPLAFGSSATLNVRSLANNSKLSANGLTINAQQGVCNTGEIHSGAQLDINADTVTNEGSGQIGAKGDVSITTEQNLINKSPIKTGSLVDVGQARIFSGDGSVTLTSQNGNITNDFATIHAMLLHFKARHEISNTGYLLAFDRNGTSTFFAQHLKNSCNYTEQDVKTYDRVQESYYRIEKYEGVNAGTFFTFGIYRPTRTRKVLDYHYVDKPRIVHKIYARSNPGHISFAGNCIVDASKCDIEGGTFVVGGSLTNSKGQRLSFKARNIGQFRGTVQANDLTLALSQLNSQGAQFRGQSIGIHSQGTITIVSGTKDAHLQLQTFVRPTDFAARYAALFDRHADGSVHLRAPETESNRWDVSQTVTTKPLDALKPIRVMISPEALLRVFSLVPTGDIGLFRSPLDTFTLLHGNAQRVATNGVLSQVQAASSLLSLLVWDVQEKDGVQELYPVLVFPQTLKRITDDVYAEGALSLVTQDSLYLGQTHLYAGGPMTLHADRQITQTGGVLRSETSIVVEAPQIVHEICKEVLFDLRNQDGTTIATKAERVTDVPVMQAPIIAHKGNVKATGVQIQADTYEHAGGDLNVNAAVLKAETHTAFHKGRKSVTSHSTVEEAVPSVIQANVAQFHGDTTLTGTLAQIANTYKYARLTLAAAVTTNSSSAIATRKGFFRTTTVTTESSHQKALPTVLSGDVIKDMNAKGGPLVMRSSILNMLNCKLKTNLIQETTALQNWTKTTTKVSGWTLPWFDDPRPALIQSINTLIEADATADRLTAGLRSVTNSLRLIADGLNVGVSKGAYIPTLAFNALNKIASLSYGTTTTREEVRQEIPVLNQIKGQVLRIRNARTHLEGPVSEGTIDLQTEEFTALAPQKRTTRKMESTSTTISFNPLQVFTSGPLGLLPGISQAKATGNEAETDPKTVSIVADDVVLRVGNLAFSGAQLAAKIVDAIVDGTMTLASLQREVIENEKQTAWSLSLNSLGAGLGGALKKVGAMTGFQKFLHRVNSSPLGAAPTFRTEDRQHVERYVAEMAQFVGTERFTLKVGEALIKRSAEVGLRINGVVKDSGINAGRVLNQPLQDVHIDQHDVVSIPLADTLALFGAVNELTVLRRQAFDAMKAQGLSDQRKNPYFTSLLRLSKMRFRFFGKQNLTAFKKGL